MLIAEGDSWFDYPLDDVLRILEDHYGYDVESVAHRGDRVEDMAYGEGQLEEFCRIERRIVADPYREPFCCRVAVTTSRAMSSGCS